MIAKTLSVLLLASIAMAISPTWRYYPTNSVQDGVTASGLSIYIEPRGVFTVTAVTQNGDSAPITTTREMSSDFGQDFLPIHIDNLDHFHVLRLTITAGGRTIVYENPKAGKLYEVAK